MHIGKVDGPLSPWPWIQSHGIPSCNTHQPLPTYQISFKLQKLCGWTDASMYARAYGRADRHWD